MSYSRPASLPCDLYNGSDLLRTQVGGCGTQMKGAAHCKREICGRRMSVVNDVRYLGRVDVPHLHPPKCNKKPLADSATENPLPELTRTSSLLPSRQCPPWLLPFLPFSPLLSLRPCLPAQRASPSAMKRLKNPPKDRSRGVLLLFGLRLRSGSCQVKAQLSQPPHGPTS